MNRRSFLKRGLLGGALLTVGSAAWLGLRGSTSGPGPTGPLRVIDESIFPILVALAGRAVTAPGRDPVAIAHKVDEILSHGPEAVGLDTNRVLSLLENSLTGLLLRGRAVGFTELDDEGRDLALTRWRDSRIALLRSAYGGLVRVCCIAYYAVEEHGGHALIGYPGPFFKKPAPAPITARGALSKPWTPPT
jgi:hypothetical protein